MITTLSIARANRKTLNTIYSELIAEKMVLDKFFSFFLDDNELDHDSLDTPQWKIYKERLIEYTEISKLIASTEYQMRKP